MCESSGSENNRKVVSCARAELAEKERDSAIYAAQAANNMCADAQNEAATVRRGYLHERWRAIAACTELQKHDPAKAAELTGKEYRGQAEAEDLVAKASDLKAIATRAVAERDEWRERYESVCGERDAARTHTEQALEANAKLRAEVREWKMLIAERG